MNKLIKTTTSILITMSFLSGANALASQGGDDYTGTSIIQSTTDRALKTSASHTGYVLLETSAEIPACEAIEDHFDYAGTQQVHCSTDGTPQEPEWSYLY
jgi:hypothetical protein